jgi:hypothetical protein
MIERVPIVVGVTGHRDVHPDCATRVNQELDRYFRALSAQYPNSPIWLLTALAEGADRLAAEALLQAVPEDRELVAVLPMPREEYRQDFLTGESKCAFDDLLERASRTITVDDSVPAGQDERNRCYEAAGAWIVERCHLLLALWDGTDLRKPGGTSEVVKYRLERIPSHLRPGASPLDPPDQGPVDVIVTPRVSSGAVDPGMVNSFRKWPGAVPETNPAGPVAGLRDGIQMAFEASLARIDEFNREARAIEQTRPDDVTESADWLLAQGDLESLAEDEPCVRTRALHAASDALARREQVLTTSNHWRVMALYVIAMLSLQVYGGPYMWPVFVAAYLGLFGLLALVQRFNAGHEDHFFDFRGLAEGLRVQFYMQLAGTGFSVAAGYMRGQRDELDWIRKAIRTTDICAPTSVPTSSTRFELVRKTWIADQLRYFAKNAPIQDRLANKTRKAAGYALVAGVATAVLLLGLAPWVEQFGEVVFQWLLIVAAMSLLGVSVLDNLANSRAWSQQARSYSKMKILFETADRALDECVRGSDTRMAGEVLAELAREALTENGDWVLLHRERKLSFNWDA